MNGRARMVEVALCDRRADARAIDADIVAAIAGSVVEVGQLSPVRLRPAGAGRFEIVAGVHRVEAFRALGLVEIEAVIEAVGDLFAELAMIDENLCRAELGPADRARQTARRKAIYEELHPETRHGGEREASRQLGDTPRFSADTARISGQSERAVQRDAERGEKVIDEVLYLIRGTSLDTGLYLDGLKRLSPNDQVHVARRDLAEARARAEAKARERIEDKKARRAEREAELGARQAALPAKRYGVILADPEWRFETWSADGMDRAADNHYPTSPLEAIKAREVASIAADDAVLLLWATVPMLPEALEVMAAWGFSYKSHFVWLKDVAGTGYWNRNQHELLLVGTRGTVPAPAPGTQFRSALAHPVGRHSEKPPFAHEIAERHFPSLPRIELNARTARDGWDAWGLEAPAAEPAGNLSGGEVSARQGREGCARTAGEAPAASDLPDGATEEGGGFPVAAAPHESGATGGDGGDQTSQPLNVGGSFGRDSRRDGDPSSGAARHLLPQGEKEEGAAQDTEIPAATPGRGAGAGDAAAALAGEAAPPPSASPAPDLNAVIRAGYARNAPLAEIAAETGLGRAAIKHRAGRMGLGDRARQRAAVSRRRNGAAGGGDSAGH